MNSINCSNRSCHGFASLITLEHRLTDAGIAPQAIWDTAQGWDIAPEILEPWMQEAVDGLAYATFSAACMIDFEAVMIDGWVPADIRDTLVRRTAERLQQISLPGIEIPQVRPGTIGPDARALGAASLPLSDRFLVDRNAFLKG